MATTTFRARLVRNGSRVSTADIEKQLGDSAASFWLKDALRTALARDPVDAWADAAMLARLLEERIDAINGGSGR